MTHRERALAAIRHELPDRVPISWICVEDTASLLDYLGLNRCLGIQGINEYFGSDIQMVGAGSPGISLFGNSGSQSPYGSDESNKPFRDVETVEEIERFSWPDIRSLDFDSCGAALDAIHPEYAVAVGNWTSVFCEVCDFFGMENTLIHMHQNPRLIEATVAHIEDFYLQYCRRLFETAAGRADIFHMWDDFSSQRGLIISPEMWRRFFKPTYRKMFQMAKDYGLYVWFHSCGVIVDVIPDLIEMGMDVWETVQAHLPGNDPERLKREFGRYITFDGGISTQRTLPFGTPEEVRAEVRERIRVLGNQGGYICNSDHVLKRDVPPANIVALYDEIHRYREEGCTR